VVVFAVEMTVEAVVEPPGAMEVLGTAVVVTAIVVTVLRTG
jgi:hypothetical protein